MNATLALALLLLARAQLAKYTPDWDSLDSRPLPSWYDEAKIGIFLHWGVYSVPSFGSEWFWWHWKGEPVDEKYQKFIQDNYRPGWAYEDFAADFRAEFFQPLEWAKLLEKSGARYVVLTAKHHDAFCLWPCETSWHWNSVDVGPKRDLVGELADVVRANTSLRFGLYHSLFEWFNPDYLDDKRASFTTQRFPVKNTLPALTDLVNRYKPQVIWSDGDWEANYTYWRSTHFLAWLYNESPVRDQVVVNDRWGQGTMGRHGDFYTYGDRSHPKQLPSHKWENCMTLDRESWGFRRQMQLGDVLSEQELIQEVASTVALGGNILINVGPTSYGTIPPIFEERLLQLGNWLSLSGEAIYASKPWHIQQDQESNYVWFTSKQNLVYVIVTQSGDGSDHCRDTLHLSSVKADKFILLDGSPDGFDLPFIQSSSGVVIQLDNKGAKRPRQFNHGCVIKMIGAKENS